MSDLDGKEGRERDARDPFLEYGLSARILASRLRAPPRRCWHWREEKYIVSGGWFTEYVFSMRTLRLAQGHCRTNR